MSDPQPVTVSSYMHRVYLADGAVQHRLLVEGRLLGWGNHEDMVAFHQSFYTWPHPLELRPAAPRSERSAHYVDPKGDYIRIVTHDRNVMAYTHEVAHSVAQRTTGWSGGDGHDPVWAATYIDLLGRIDPYAAKLLRKAFRDLCLTVGKSVAR